MDEQKNPWTVLNERQVYDNPWIGVTEADVINPNGGKGIYGKVHFKNLAIGIVPIDDQGHTYLVGQYRFPLNAYSWEIPEGGGDPSIEPLVSAQRELLEETGLVARDWTMIQQLHLSNSVTDEFALLFLARVLEQHTAMPEETEQLIIRRLHFDEVYRMVERGEITDSMSVAAIQKVQLMRLGGDVNISD